MADRKNQRRKGSNRTVRAGTAPLLVDIESLTWGGRGVGRHGGKVIFVAKSVPGDKVLVRVDREKSSYAEGRIEAVLHPGPDRVEPKCKFFSHCGGCQWLAVAYPRQLQEKERLVRSTLRRHLEACQVEPIVPSEPPRGYRHRGDFHVKRTGAGVKIGFFQEGSHDLVNLDVCLLFDGAYNEVYARLRRALQEQRAAAWVEKVTLARSEDGGGYALAMLVGESADQAAVQSLSDMAAGLDLSGFVIAGMRAPETALARGGEPFIKYRLPSASGPDGLEIRADIRSFTQAHYALNRQMVAAAGDWLALSRHERLLDLYAGIGNFTLPLASGCKEAVAVEAGLLSHEDAKANAERNGILNIRHLPGDAAAWVGKLAAGSERFEAILLDPPRSGARDVMEALGHLGARRILYVSCNLPSLDRDLQDLARLGYRLERLKPFDLFPQTYGVETLCLLSRRG